jgi:hypothetical protein
MKLIPECTNLSVGYRNQHQESEIQNYSFAVALRDTLVANAQVLNDPTKLGHYRDPLAVETYVSNYQANSYVVGGYAVGVTKHKTVSDVHSALSNVRPHDYDYKKYTSFDDDNDYDWFMQKPKTPLPKIDVVDVVEVVDKDDALVDYASYTGVTEIKDDSVDSLDEYYDDRIDELYDDAITDYDYANKISVNALAEIIDLIDQDIDTFGEFCLAKGITVQDYTNFMLNKQISIIDRFKAYLIDYDITMTDEEIKAYVNQSHGLN